MKEAIPDLKVNYDDYYKFCVSLGIFVIVICLVLITIIFAFSSNPTNTGALLGGLTIIIVISVILVAISAFRWHENQIQLDKKLRLEVDLLNLKTFRELSEVAKEVDLPFGDHLTTAITGGNFEKRLAKAKELASTYK